jgi:hypothetical protein
VRLQRMLSLLTRDVCNGSRLASVVYKSFNRGLYGGLTSIQIYLSAVTSQ